MNSLNYDIVFFDADETLFDYQRAEEVSFKSTMSEFYDFDDTLTHQAYLKYNQINRALWQEYHQGLVTKDNLRSKRFELLFDEMDLGRSVDQFSSFYIDVMSSCQFLLPHAKEVVETLSDHCDIGIITNGIVDVQKSRFLNSALNPFIKIIVVSGEIQGDAEFKKPHPKIFDYAHQQLNPSVPKDRILMIGDSLESDIDGANQAGLHSCWFNPENHVNETDICPTYSINKLIDIMKIVGV